MNRRKRVRWAKDIAGQRIERLFQLAESEYALNPHRSDRYVWLARRIAMRMRVRIPRRLKRKICKHCHGFLSSENSRIRLRKGIITITCLRCGGQMRYPYKH